MCANGARERLPELSARREGLDSLPLSMPIAMAVRAVKGFNAYAAGAAFMPGEPFMPLEGEACGRLGLKSSRGLDWRQCECFPMLPVIAAFLLGVSHQRPMMGAPQMPPNMPHQPSCWRSNNSGHSFAGRLTFRLTGYASMNRSGYGPIIPCRASTSVRLGSSHAP